MTVMARHRAAPAVQVIEPDVLAAAARWRRRGTVRRILTHLLNKEEALRMRDADDYCYLMRVDPLAPPTVVVDGSGRPAGMWWNG